MITQQEYRKRRQALAAALPTGAVAIIPAATELFRNADTSYRFRQDSDFYYLTGFNEPDALLVIVAGPQEENHLFMQASNPAAEQWTGKRLGLEGAKDQLGMQESYALESLDIILPKLLSEKIAIYYAVGRSPKWEKRILGAWKKVKQHIRQGIIAPESLEDLEPFLSEMRLFKSPTELALMRQAAEISTSAHLRAMLRCKKLDNERQLEAELLYEFMRGGCRSTAYDSIVGSGANACTLHYTDNNQPLKAGELVLIDAGGEFQNYAADITRVLPINGKFSPEQRAIYEIVLAAQKAGIEMVKPGTAWNLIQQKIVNVLTEGLQSLGLVQGSLEDLIATEAYKPFYMHSSGHWLGLDVHDAGRYKLNGEWRSLEPGMTLTVEPGLYIPAGLKGVDKRWWDIGIRLEDDLLVTDSSHENLTAALPIEIVDVEAAVNG